MICPTVVAQKESGKKHLVGLGSLAVCRFNFTESVRVAGLPTPDLAEKGNFLNTFICY